MTNGKSIEIYLYLLQRREKTYPNEQVACIIAAASPIQAGSIANESCKEEGYIWTDENKVAISKIGVADDGISGIILASDKTIRVSKVKNHGNSLFLLERTETPDADKWAFCVVAAPDQTTARTIANEKANDTADQIEGSQFKNTEKIWTDGGRTSIKKIGSSDEIHGVVLTALDQEA